MMEILKIGRLKNEIVFLNNFFYSLQRLKHKIVKMKRE